MKILARHRALIAARRVSTAYLHDADAFTNALVACSAGTKPTSDLPMNGTTVAVKDNICTNDMPTTCSSAMLRGFNPPYDATVVQLLRQNGAHIIGKTNCDEFGMGSRNVHSIHGPVVNPYKTVERRSAGGSSGGSAAAVSAGYCDVALATDTGGSTRLPASYCGVVGFKPSYGMISRWGVVSFADSLDCVGIMSKTVDRVRETFVAVSKYDEMDPTSALPEIREPAVKAAGQRSSEISSLQGLRIGIPKEYFPSELTSAVQEPIRRTIQRARELGAEIIPISLPSTSYALSAYYVLASAEASSNMARYDGVQYGLKVDAPSNHTPSDIAEFYALTRTKGFGSEVKKRVLLGTYALRADAFNNYFLQAQRVRQLVKNDFNRVFTMPDVRTYDDNSNLTHPNISTVDFVLHPSAIQIAPVLDSSRDADNSGLEDYVQDVLTVPASLAGLPALNIPCNDEVDGWPVGFSLVGQWGCDEYVLRVGKLFEDSNK